MKEAKGVNWFRRFMSGRNGTDQLGFAMLIACMLLNLIGSLTRVYLLSLLATVLLVLCIIRFFSRNLPRRQAENRRFLETWYKLRNRFLRQKDKLRQCKDYRFFKCPGCGNTLRVPKGKGKIYVTCPRCGERFVKKT